MQSLNIAIAGAGTAGLATALYLHHAGHRVTIFERFDQPRPVGSGLILQPTGLTVLHDLGLLSDILALGVRIDRLYGSDARSGRTVLDVRYAAQSGGRFGLAVHRAALFEVLFRAVEAAGIAIETGVDLAAADIGAQVTLVEKNGRRLGAFDLLIDATGARSVLRRMVPNAVEPRALPYGAFWASLPWPAGASFSTDALVQRYDRASVMVGVMPIGRPSTSADPMAAFFWSLKPADAERVRSNGLAAWKDRVLSVWPDCAALTDQILDWDQLTLARYGHHTLRIPVGRRLAVIGDAAHSTSPQLGQGANMALLDARALAYSIVRSPDLDGALGAYAAARRVHVRVFQAASRMFTPFYQSDSTVFPFVRDRLVATIAKVPPALQLLASLVAGTVIDPFKAIGLREVDWQAI